MADIKNSTSIKVRKASDINTAILSKFVKSHELALSPEGKEALGALKLVVKYFLKADSEGLYNLDQAFAFALDNPHLLKSFCSLGLGNLEAVSYAYGTLGNNTYLGVYVPPKFYVAKERPFAMTELVGASNIVPVTISVWEKEKVKGDPDMYKVVETFFSQSQEIRKKPKVVFDMDGTLVRWDDDWSLGQYGVSAWKQPGFYEHCIPHKPMVKLCNDLIASGAYEVFTISPTNKIPRLVDERLRWNARYIPDLDSSHMLFVEDGRYTPGAIMPDKNTIIFDDYHLSLKGYATFCNDQRGFPVLVQVMNNLTIVSDPIVTEFTCNADQGLKIDEIPRMFGHSVIGGLNV